MIGQHKIVPIIVERRFQLVKIIGTGQINGHYAAAGRSNLCVLEENLPVGRNFAAI